MASTHLTRDHAGRRIILASTRGSPSGWLPCHTSASQFYLCEYHVLNTRFADPRQSPVHRSHSCQLTIRSHTDLSRRGLLKGALLGGVALSLTPPMARAQQMLSGAPSVDSIRSIGLQPGRVDLSLNENPNGPSIRAIQEVAANLAGVNRYTRDNVELEWSLLEALARYDGVTLEKTEPTTPFGSTPSPYLITYMGSSHLLKLLPIAHLSREGGDVVDAKGAYTSIQREALSVKEEFGVPIDVTSVPLTNRLSP